MEIVIGFLVGAIVAAIFTEHESKKAIKEIEEDYERIQKDTEEYQRERCRYCSARLGIDIMEFPLNNWQERLIEKLPEWEDKDKARLHFAKRDTMDKTPVPKRRFVPFYDRIYDVLSRQCVRIRKLVFDTKRTK